MIAADVASKAADVDLGLVDRFNGSLVITGDVAAVEAAMQEVLHKTVFENIYGNCLSGLRVPARTRKSISPMSRTVKDCWYGSFLHFRNVYISCKV